MTQLLFSFLILWLGSMPTMDRPQQSFVLPDNERVGQLFVIGFYGTEVTDDFANELRTYRPGGVLLLGRNIKDAEQLKRLTHDLQAIATEGGRPPLWIAVDQEGGIVTRIKWTEYPQDFSSISAMSAHTFGQNRAYELRELGINMNLAPVLDSRHPKDALYPRALHGDENASGTEAVLYSKGHRSMGVIPVPKHFPGYDGIRFNPELTTVPTVPETPKTSLFRRVVTEAQLPIVMASHVIYSDRDPADPFPLSAAGIQFFRKTFGDKTLLISDDLLSPAFQKRYSITDLADKSVASGLDLFLLGDPNKALGFMFSMRELSKYNPVLVERLAKTAERVVEIKKQYASSKP